MKPFPPNSRRRRIGRNASAGGALVAAGMLTLSIVGAVSNPGSDVVQAAAAGTPPVAQSILSPTSGNSSTVFELDPAATAANCEQDSATGGWRWQTFMTSAANDPATLTYDGTVGPIGPGLTQPLWAASGGSPVINNNTAPTTGQIIQFPEYSFAVYPAGFVSAGDYWVGYACSDPAGATRQFWSTRITVTTDAAGEFTWAQAVVDTTTTTTTTTTVADTTTTTSTTVASSTTTTTAGTTSTTVAGTPVGTQSGTVTPASPAPGASYQVSFPNCQVGETITFAQPQSTPASVTAPCQSASTLDTGSVQGLRMPAQLTTATATGSFTNAPTNPGSFTVTMTGTASAQRTVTFVVVAASTPVVGGAGATTGGSPTGTTFSAGTLPSTGSSTTSIIVWAVLLLVFGRIALLLGRKPKVRSVGL